MRNTFTEAEARQAHADWGCNCGPAALAFALQVGLDAVRHAIPHFAERRYTNPTMMADGLRFFGLRFTLHRDRDRALLFAPQASLVRIQLTGPWTAPGALPVSWAYRQTHWIATWQERGVPLVFDVNSGITGLDTWEHQTVPAIVATLPRADGGWWPTHCYRLLGRE